MDHFRNWLKEIRQVPKIVTHADINSVMVTSPISTGLLPDFSSIKKGINTDYRPGQRLVLKNRPSVPPLQLSVQSPYVDTLNSRPFVPSAHDPIFARDQPYTDQPITSNLFPSAPKAGNTKVIGPAPGLDSPSASPPLSTFFGNTTAVDAYAHQLIGPEGAELQSRNATWDEAAQLIDLFEIRAGMHDIDLNMDEDNLQPLPLPPAPIDPELMNYRDQASSIFDDSDDEEPVHVFKELRSRVRAQHRRHQVSHNHNGIIASDEEIDPETHNMFEYLQLKATKLQEVELRALARAAEKLRYEQQQQQQQQQSHTINSGRRHDNVGVIRQSSRRRRAQL
jgi:hypothetical protein